MKKGSVWFVGFLVLSLLVLTFFVALFKVAIIPSSLGVGGTVRDQLLSDVNIDESSTIGNATKQIIDDSASTSTEIYSQLDTITYVGMAFIAIVAIIYALKYGKKQEEVVYGQ